MSISGNLLDVSVADVMQFVHLGGRTGTLVMKAGAKQAEIGFHRGRIISAWTPSSKRLGDLLVGSGVISRDVLDEALERQQRQVPRASLGMILVTTGAVTKDALRDAIADQIEHTIYDLVTWRSGEFEFALDELRPVDDIAVYPGDILPDINLNTQIVVLEALRIFDERNRDSALLANGEAQSEGASPESQQADGSLDRPVASEHLEAEEALETLAIETSAILGSHIEGWTEEEEDEGKTRFQVVSEDRDLTESLRAGSSEENLTIAEVKLWDAGLTLPGESPPVVLLDMRHSGIELSDLQSFCRGRAHASILVVADGPTSTARLYEAGALAALPADADAIQACLTNVLRSRGGRAQIVSELHETNAGFAKLRRVVADLRSGLLSATVALNLMQVISESVERAIMFVVRRGQLRALGAFGSDLNGDPLAQATQELVVPLEHPNALCEAIRDGQTRSLRFDDADLPQEFKDCIGRPRTGQIVLFPVIGSSQVNSVVYTDNGPVSREIEEIEILELAAAQVGVAFENELLRRKMAGLDPPGKGSLPLRKVL